MMLVAGMAHVVVHAAYEADVLRAAMYATSRSKAKSDAGSISQSQQPDVVDLDHDFLDPSGTALPKTATSAWAKPSTRPSACAYSRTPRHRAKEYLVRETIPPPPHPGTRRFTSHACSGVPLWIVGRP
jgi:hypothetical protein